MPTVSRTSAEGASREVHFSVAEVEPSVAQAKRPVVLVPGLGSGARLFGTLPRRFARAGHPCAAVDPVGLPPSSPLTGAWSMREAAADVVAVCATFDQPVTLVGTSLGGKVALEAVALEAANRAIEQHTSPIARLVLLASAALHAPRAASVYSFFKAVAERAKPDTDDLAAMTAPFLFGRTFHRERAGVVADIVRATRPDAATLAFMRTQTEALGSWHGADLLPHCTVPTLCIAGGEDTLTDASDIEATAEALPHGEFLLIPHAGHSLLLEAREAYDAVLKFA